MSVLESLQRDYVRAISTGKVLELSQQLESQLERTPQSFYHWIVLARIREFQRDLDGAQACYQQALQLADPGHPGTARLLREVERFAARHRRALVSTMKGRTLPTEDSTTDAPNAALSPRSERCSIRPGSPSSSGHSLGTGMAGPGARSITRGRSEPSASVQVPSFRGTVKAEDVDQALADVEQAYQTGDRRPEMFLRYGRLLQQKGELKRAVEVLDEGLSQHNESDALPLLNARTQILSALGQWAEAAKGYEELLKAERRPGARRFYRIQLALMYRKDGKLEDACRVLDEILGDDSSDLVVRRLRLSLGQPNVSNHPVDTVDDYAHEEATSLSPYISPLLWCDLEKVEFRDPEILKKGGRVDVYDAKHLMERALSAKKRVPFAQRYPMFQEAAKAFAQLPPGSCDPIDFLYAVARYALLKGGALVFDFRGKHELALVDRRDLTELRRLRDSIASYSLETVDVLLQIEAGQRRGGRLPGRPGYAPQAGFIFTALANHLWTQMAFAHAAGHVSGSPTAWDWKFLHFFQFCLAGREPKLRPLAYQTIVACGALSKRFLEFLRSVPDGREILRSLGSSSLDRDIASWAQDRQAVDEFFSRLEGIALAPTTITQLQKTWEGFPRERRSLLDTDLELADGVQAALAALGGYEARSGEERTLVLSRSRGEIERLLRLIDEAPTYWGRVRFEPMLKRWLAALAKIERQRLGELRPVLVVSLEPPVFREEKETGAVVGSVLVRNEGRAAALGFSVDLQVRPPGQPVALWHTGPIYGGELPVGTSSSIECRVPRNGLSAGLDSPYTVDARVRWTGSGDTGDELHESFTLEIDRGGSFQRGDVPWDEVTIPSEHLFKGRERDLDELERHLKSPERSITPLLVGLTRTGKSTLLKYLTERLHLKPIDDRGGPTRFFCVNWDFIDAANYTEERFLWRYLLCEQLIDQLQRLEAAQKLPRPLVLPPMDEPGFQHWRPLLQAMLDAGLYPVFLIDEFTGYRTMVEKKLVGPPFLAAVRSFTIEGLASFVFAGKYGLQQLVRDAAYGTTGQLVNVVERRVSSIDEPSARQLVDAMKPKLRFTEEATASILRLSFRIPYFIQIICKNAGWLAAATGRSWVGQPDLERLVQVLTGEADQLLPGGVCPLSPGVFQDNMVTQGLPSHRALLSTICHLARDPQRPENPRMVLHRAIVDCWKEHGLRDHERVVAEAIAELKERQVLLERDDDGQPSYMISVDLFRRWWGAHHRYIKPELDLLK